MEEPEYSGTERRTQIDPEVMAEVKRKQKQGKQAHNVQILALALFVISSISMYFSY